MVANAASQTSNQKTRNKFVRINSVPIQTCICILWWSMLQVAARVPPQHVPCTQLLYVPSVGVTVFASLIGVRCFPHAGFRLKTAEQQQLPRKDQYMRNGGGLGGIGRQHRQHDLSVQRTQRCIADDITDVIDHFHLSMKTFSTAKKITFTDHVNRGIFEKIRNVLQTIFKPSVHHSSRFFGKLFGAIGDAVFVVGFGAAHNETLGVETNHLIVTHAHQS